MDLSNMPNIRGNIETLYTFDFGEDGDSHPYLKTKRLVYVTFENSMQTAMRFSLNLIVKDIDPMNNIVNIVYKSSKFFTEYCDSRIEKKFYSEFQHIVYGEISGQYALNIIKAYLLMDGYKKNGWIIKYFPNYCNTIVERQKSRFENV